MRVGTDESPPPPLCFGLPGTPDFSGFEVDLLFSIGAKLGLTLRCQSVPWLVALEDLQHGRLDMLCRAVSITPERRRLVEFSDPYLETALALVVRLGSAIQGPDDLIGIRVGVRRGTIAEQFLRTQCPAASVVTFDAQAEAYRALAEGNAGAVVDHHPIAAYFAQAVPGIMVARVLEGTNLHYGFVFAPGNQSLLRSVNLALATLRSEGTWDRLRRRWLSPTGGD